MLVFVFLVGWIASAFFCASVASEKGYSGTSWGIAGFGHMSVREGSSFYRRLITWANK